MIHSNKLKQLLCSHEVLTNEKDYWVCKDCNKTGTESYFSRLDKSKLNRLIKFIIKLLFDDNDKGDSHGLVF